VIAALGGCHGWDGVGVQSRALSAGFQVGAARSFGTNTTGRAYIEHSYPSVAYGGGVFLTTWFSEDLDKLYAVRTRASDGVVLDDRRVLMTGVHSLTHAEVDWDGQSFLTVWADYDSRSSSNKIYARRVGTDGKFVDPAPIAIRDSISFIDQVAMIHGASGHLIVWRERQSGGVPPADLFGARISDDGKMLGSVIPLGTVPTAQALAVAFDGTNYLVAWEDGRETAPRIYGNRVRASDGALLDGATGFAIGSPGSVGPAVAFDGTNYLVAYQTTSTSLGGRRFRASDGSAIDAGDLPLMSIAASAGTLKPPCLTFDGTHFLLSWRQQLPGSLGLRHQAARIDPATGGDLDGAGVTIATSSAFVDDRNRHAVAVGSGRLFAAYSQQDIFQQDLHALFPIDVRGVFIAPATGALDGASVLLSRSAPWQDAPDSSSDGPNHLVVWQEWNGTHFEIRGGRVSNTDGTVRDPAGITIARSETADQLEPRTAANGTNHLVVWWDGSSLRANRVQASDGSLLDGSGTALPATPGALSWESPRYQVASDGTDYLVFWTAGSGYNGPGKAARVRGSDGILLDPTPRDAGSSTAERFYARLAFSGSRYVALWMETVASGYQLKAVRLATDGTLLDATPIVISNVSGFTKDPRMAGDGENMLITWTDLFVLKARRLRLSDGVVLDSADLPLHNGLTGELAALAFDGSSFVVSWQGSLPPSSSQLFAARVSRMGTLLDPAPTPISDVDVRPALALSAGADGKLLSTYLVYDDSPDIQTQRVRSRLLADTFPPPDAAPPPPADAAPDATVPPDAAPPPYPPTPDANLAPDAAPSSPRPDAAAPGLDAAAGQGATPDVAAAGDSAPLADGATVADAGPAPADSSSGGDINVPRDAGVTSTDGPAMGTDGAATDATVPDAAAEKPKVVHHGGCEVAAQGRAPVPALLLVVVPLVLRRRRR
jgi:hypothetical protein